MSGRREEAFTLTELLVVITIIAVLASLLLPALSRAKTAAISAHCKSNLRQLSILLRLYLDNEGYYPAWRRDYGNSTAWQEAIGAGKFLYGRRPASSTPSFARCPGDRDEYARPSYGYNANGANPRLIIGQDPPYGHGLGGWPHREKKGGWHLVPEAAVVNPSDTYAIGDSFASTDARQIIFGEGTIGRQVHFASGVWAEYLRDSAAAVGRRHDGKLNVSLCDGHVESLSIGNFLLNQDPRWKRRWNNQNTP